MLSAYVDDSGNSELPIFVLAGFVSTPTRWEAFSDEWRSVLNLTRRVEYFKGGEAFNLRGQFHGWTEAERDVRVLMLVDVIKKHAIAGFITQILYLAAEGTVVPRGSGKLFSCVQLLNFVSLLSLLQTQKFGEPSQIMHLILDRSIFKGLAKKALADFGLFQEAIEKLGRQRNNLQWPPDEKDDLQVLPLQAADMFAWLWRNQAKRFFDKQPELPIMGRVMDRVMAAPDPLPMYIYHLGPRELHGMASRWLTRNTLEKWERAMANVKITYQG